MKSHFSNLQLFRSVAILAVGDSTVGQEIVQNAFDYGKSIGIAFQVSSKNII